MTRAEDGQDRRLAATLYGRRTPVDAVRTALLLAAARRTLRSAQALTLAPIRTLFFTAALPREVLVEPQ